MDERSLSAYSAAFMHAARFPGNPPMGEQEHLYLIVFGGGRLNRDDMRLAADLLAFPQVQRWVE